MSMARENIDILLQEKIGLASGIINPREITKAIEKRRLITNKTDLTEYWLLVQTSDRELQELIEEIVIPETWFFRDGKPFTLLVEHISELLISPNSLGMPVRLLSVPCASGEEPYSMAMSLLDAGISPDRFRIDAIDISQQVINKAKKAIYNRNSFRGGNIDFRDRYFKQVGNEYQLLDIVKNTVTFMTGNLLDSYFLIEKKCYDIIFCRNVMIYFDIIAREKAVKNLDRLLADRGLLFVGHSEMAQILESKFTPVRYPLAFAYRKKSSQGNINTIIEPKKETKFLSNNTTLEPVQLIKTENPITSLTVRSGIYGETNNSSNKDNNIWPQQPNKIEPKTRSPENSTEQQLIVDLSIIRNLADRNQLNEAATLCETYLKQNFASVEAYLLLGQIQQARGLENQAKQCFQKALYLDAQNYEALTHLILLEESQGDMNKAKILRQRLQRLNQP